MSTHAEALQAQLDVKTAELEKAWTVIAELRRALYIEEVLRKLAEGRMEDAVRLAAASSARTKEEA